MKKPSQRTRSWASNQNKKKKKIKGKWNKKIIIKNLILLTIAAILLGAILILGLFAWFSRDLPDPNSLSTREVAQSTKIFDRTGENLLYEISGDEKRTLVTLDEIPEYAQWATIVAEDRNFYNHNGIAIKGILRAILSNVTSLDPTGQGGSTITQQLVKNTILTREQTYTRKIKEILLSLALERRYTKQEILQLYLNEISYGSTNYGIESASQTYFNKSVKDLTIAESATLAALPNAPSMFLNNPDRLKLRRDWIINSLKDYQHITEKEAEKALASDTSVNITISGIKAPHFVLLVKQQLEEKYGERLVEQGGLKVITTISLDMQEIAEKAIKTNKENFSERYNFNNSGLVAMDPKTGQILSMVGSADYFDDEIDGQVNITTRPLQPGSSFKPIVYAAAFSKGYTPNTLLWDTKTNFPTATGNYSPNNYDLKEHGAVTIRKALQGSLNIPAVKALYLVGTQNALDFAEKLGYSTFKDRSNFGLAIVLGGAEVKLVDHVAAYQVFANEGKYNTPVMILKVEDSKGDILEEWKKPEDKKVIDKKIADTITNVLSDNQARSYAFGLNSPLTIPGRPVAAKTGTTNNYKDAWTIGYTPSLVAGVWTGNTNGTEMNRNGGGSTVAAPIWNDFMREALKDTPVENFPSVSIPKTGIDILDGNMPSKEITIDTASGKLATERTPERFRETKNCGNFHSILYFIDKNSPLSETENGSQNDPYFESWETGITSYLEKENQKAEEDGTAKIEICEIPTEEDDLHVAQNEPKINIKSPKRNATVNNSFTVEIRASAPRGLSRFEYFINNKLIKVDYSPTGTNIILPSWVNSGNNVLSVIAYDDIDNKRETKVNINITNIASISGVSITNPFNNQIIEKTASDYSISIEQNNPDKINILRVYVQNIVTGANILIAEIPNPPNLNIVNWTLSDPGLYIITATGTTSTGKNIDSSPIVVTIKNPPPPTPEVTSTQKTVPEN